MTAVRPVLGRQHFLAAIETENERVRTGPRYHGGGNLHYRDKKNDALAEATLGLDLTDYEWHVLEWFVTWDAQDAIASIIRKAREQGPTS